MIVTLYLAGLAHIDLSKHKARYAQAMHEWNVSCATIPKKLGRFRKQNYFFLYSNFLLFTNPRVGR